MDRVFFGVRLKNSTTIVKQHQNQIRAHISDNIPELEVTLQTLVQFCASIELFSFVFNKRRNSLTLHDVLLKLKRFAT